MAFPVKKTGIHDVESDTELAPHPAGGGSLVDLLSRSRKIELMMAVSVCGSVEQACEETGWSTKDAWALLCDPYWLDFLRQSVEARAKRLQITSDDIVIGLKTNADKARDAGKFKESTEALRILADIHRLTGAAPKTAVQNNYHFGARSQNDDVAGRTEQ